MCPQLILRTVIFNFLNDNNNNNNNTDRTIRNNKPDIIIRDNEKRTCILIEVAISADSNVIKKEAEKFKIERPYNRN